MQVIWTFSNILSLMRVFLSIPVCMFLFSGNTLMAFIVCCLASMTDILDGFIARKMKQITEFGKVIDPLADKIFISAIIISLFIQDRVPLWFLVLVIVKDLLVLSGGLIMAKSKKYVPASNVFGKAAVVSIGLTFIAILFDYPSKEVTLYFMILTSIIIILSFLSYLKSFVAFLRPHK
jgi:cardiolipin synthase (CMP-forming)